MPRAQNYFRYSLSTCLQIHECLKEIITYAVKHETTNCGGAVSSTVFVVLALVVVVLPNFNAVCPVCPGS